MVKVAVTNNKGQSFSAKFETQEQTDAWVQQEIEKNSWGLGARWERANGLSSPAPGFTETRTAVVDGANITEYFYPSEYTIAQQDATAEKVEEQILSGVVDDEAKGQEVSRQLSKLLRTKLSKGDITVEQLAAFVETEEVKSVERYLDRGYLTLVVPIITQGKFALISEEEKAYFLRLLS
jgi:hypothetical protein